MNLRSLIASVIRIWMILWHTWFPISQQQAKKQWQVFCGLKDTTEFNGGEFVIACFELTPRVYNKEVVVFCIVVSIE